MRGRGIAWSAFGRLRRCCVAVRQAEKLHALCPLIMPILQCGGLDSERWRGGSRCKQVKYEGDTALSALCLLCGGGERSGGSVANKVRRCCGGSSAPGRYSASAEERSRRAPRKKYTEALREHIPRNLRCARALAEAQLAASDAEAAEASAKARTCYRSSSKFGFAYSVCDRTEQSRLRIGDALVAGTGRSGSARPCHPSAAGTRAGTNGSCQTRRCRYCRLRSALASQIAVGLPIHLLASLLRKVGRDARRQSRQRQRRGGFRR